jgi:hypothetical protein
MHLSHMLQTIFSDMGLKEVTIEKTDDIVIFKIPVLTLHSKESIVVQNSNALNKDF